MKVSAVVFLVGMITGLISHGNNNLSVIGTVFATIGLYVFFATLTIYQMVKKHRSAIAGLA
ncbi:MAG: hypothetical protein ACHQVK_03890, partial [Candidatus Paceibacterales bacterium]